MKRMLKVSGVVGLLVLASAASGQEPAGNHPMDSGFTTAAPYAQKLVDDTVAKHPEVVVLMMHVQPPQRAQNVVIASNIGRIGEIGDEDDMRCIHTGKSNLEVNKTGDRFEDELTLKDRSGRVIGALGLVFHYKEGDDKARLVGMAEKIRGELSRQIQSKAALFAAAP